MTRPFKDTTAAQFIRSRIIDLKGRKTQAQIAQEAGFPNASFLAMLKSGANKIALDRVPDLARALDVDPAHLIRLALAQSIGETASRAVLEIFGTPVTANEVLWLQELRDTSDNADLRPTAKGRAAIRVIFGK